MTVVPMDGAADGAHEPGAISPSSSARAPSASPFKLALALKVRPPDHVNFGELCRKTCSTDAKPQPCETECRYACRLLPDEMHRLGGQCIEGGADISGDAHIQEAKELLIRHGFARREQFDGVNIRSCRYRGCTDTSCDIRAMVPSPDLIVFSDLYKTWPKPLLAALMAHELLHVKQQTALGLTRYMCSYGVYLRQGLGYERSNPFEKEAYELQSKVRKVLGGKVD